LKLEQFFNRMQIYKSSMQ